jgi:hypothetical protein
MPDHQPLHAVPHIAGHAHLPAGGLGYLRLQPPEQCLFGLLERILLGFLQHRGHQPQPLCLVVVLALLP